MVEVPQIQQRWFESGDADWDCSQIEKNTVFYRFAEGE